MKIILNPREGASRADLIALAQTAHFALSNGITGKPPGETMCVTHGKDLRNTFGVVRRKESISVYPPSDPASPTPAGAISGAQEG